MIEVHGSLYDPSNPVVKYGGGKRADLHKKGASRIPGLNVE